MYAFGGYGETLPVVTAGPDTAVSIFDSPLIDASAGATESAVVWDPATHWSEGATRIVTADQYLRRKAMLEEQRRKDASMRRRGLETPVQAQPGISPWVWVGGGLGLLWLFSRRK